jgi:hypothetical protein
MMPDSEDLVVFKNIDARPDEGCDLNGPVTNKLTSRDMTQVQIGRTFLYEYQGKKH